MSAWLEKNLFCYVLDRHKGEYTWIDWQDGRSGRFPIAARLV